MEFVHDRNSNIIFSLHGSRVHEMKFHNKMLKLKVSELFRYVDNEEKSYPGEICFYDCDLDLCSVLIFNKTLGQGYFKGKAISMKEFMDKYDNLEFEIITEGYYAKSTTYMDGFGKREKSLFLVSCIFGTGEIWCIESKTKF